MATPWKDKRTGTYYIRRAVPADLRDQLGSVYKRSLRTKNLAEAKVKFAQELAKCDKVFADAKARIAAPSLTEISRDQAEKLADAWLAQLLEEDEEVRIGGLDEKDYRKMQESIDISDIGTRHAVARGDTSSIEFEVEDFIDSHDLKIDRESVAFRTLAYYFLKAMAKFTSLASQRHQGEPVESPRVPTSDDIAATIGQGSLPHSGDSGELLSTIYERWKVERKPTKKLTADWDRVFRRFAEFHGDLPVREITRRHIASFKDALFRFPSNMPNAVRALPMREIIDLYAHDEEIKRLAPASVKRDLSALRAVLEWAIENGYIEYNPAAGIKVREAKSAKDKRLPFAEADLKAIFSCPVFTEGSRPQAGGGEGAYWIPLIGLYTGARLEEIGTLRVSDIKYNEYAKVHYFDLNTIEKGKSLKSKTSKREVPVHSELIQLGFLDYVDEIKKAGGKSASLFPDLVPDVRGVVTGNWSKWFGRYRKGTIGITDPRKTFHSFRHTLQDALRAVAVDEALIDAIAGRSGGGVGRAYGTTHPLEVKRDALERMSYRGILIGID